MNFDETSLPTDRKFGIFFAFIWSILCVMSVAYEYHALGIFMGFLSVSFLLVVIVNDSLLHPLNKLWMHFGLLLSKIISPLVLGLIYFALFVPISILFIIVRRDELSLNFLRKPTYWKKRSASESSVTDFRKQY